MIDFQNLQDSLVFYEDRDFRRIESPWTVTKAVSDITRPPHADDWTIIEKNKVLVASGEQSFLYMYMKGFLPRGCFQTITPCFRNDLFDKTHTKYFMKNELIDTENVTQGRLKEIIGMCENFFHTKLGGQIKTVQTDTLSFDLMYEGIELGSYGIRSCEYLSWIYATGCAEPRLSYCQKLNV